MMGNRSNALRALVLVLFAACGPASPHRHGQGGDGGDDSNGIPDDVSQALSQLPDATVLMWTTDGLPTYVVGEMGKVGAMQDSDPAAAETALRPALPPVLAPFRLHAEDLALRKLNVDEDGNRHFR